MINNTQKKKIIILGSTGSIGINTLDIIRKYNNYFEVVALSCNNSFGKIVQQAIEFSPVAISIIDEIPNENLPNFENNLKIYYSEAGLLKMISETDADIVVNGIAGAKGLLPSVYALKSGKNLALANKETIVMAGKQIIDLANKNQVKIIPVDSEHSAIFHLLEKTPIENIKELILTASGGPFLNLDIKEFNKITIDDTLNHPNWKMGKKITIDSATMANKGLEIIEAQILFNFDISKIKVVIHPQSIVHSMIKTMDGCLYAQMSNPDMRIPIQNALTYPNILPVFIEEFDIYKKALSFIPVDYNKYRMLDIAYNAAKIKGIYPIVYNAANEIAVEAFLNHQLSFLQIPDFVQAILDFEWKSPIVTIEDILYIDKEVRIKSKFIIESKFAK